MKRLTRYGVWILVPVIAFSALSGLAAPKEKRKSSPQFNRDIRPILSENCFACHGPDQNKRMANLRLDVREDAIKHGAITPGNPQKSALISRVFSTADAKIMPPPYSHKQLTPSQKETLRQWVQDGAIYERHWSFVPLPLVVPAPVVKNAAWSRNEIDLFVLSRLEKENIKPSPDASRDIWLRRVTLDLTGIPPTLKERDAFLADTTPNAYEKAVDRLLASPRYGERMALPWLDVARYADSYGYQSDQLCPTWPYRDWVVKAFNNNTPYNQFITEQLAGDLLPNPTQETRLATAFNRLHRMTNEGGSVAEEWREEGVADRVKTFGTAFLGLTTECARCHDHKYDPISQRDFYALTAFFNSINEHGLYDQGGIVPTPSLLLPTSEQANVMAKARTTVAEGEKKLADVRRERESEFQSWRAQTKTAVVADRIGAFDFERFDGSKLPNLVPGATSGGELSDAVRLVEGKSGKAAQFDGECNLNFPGIARFTRYTPFTIAFWMQDARQTDGDAVIYQACAGTDTGPYGYDLTIDKGRLTARMMRHWPGNAIAIRTVNAVPANVWTSVAVTYDGSSRASGLRIYINGKPAPSTVIVDKLYKGVGVQTLVFGQRFRDRGFKGGRLDNLNLFARSLAPVEVAQLSYERSPSDTLALSSLSEADLRQYYFSAIDPAARQATKALMDARMALVNAEDGQYEISVMEETPSPRPTYVLSRGRYDASKTAANLVGRETPAGIYPFPKNLRRDRLGLAQWLTLPNHPLTARVEVNRMWSIFFGRGLTETVEDFGVQGKAPTHPELLDFLARDFIQTGWNVKRMMKKIALSRTYRQASALRPELRERDPQNILLARGPSQRLNAEAIRDSALSAGGLLAGNLGGPPVSPYQPGDLWRESNSMSPAYQQGKGQELYRRSLYTVWKRTAPMPNMMAFDAASREVCTARRGSTNTPLQALILLNDPQFVEAARAVGQRTLKEAGSDDTMRVRFAFRLLAVREPTAQEQKLLTDMYADQRASFAQEPEAAAKLIAVGESKADASLPPVELAAATALAQTILNLDATVWKR